MKRVLALLLVGGVMLSTVLLAGSQRPADSGAALELDSEARNPWTSVTLADKPEAFHFAVVSDRTGGARPKAFAKAVAQLNLLKPAFVLSVGDLIEGYTEEETKLAAQWQEVERDVRKLTMPFFYVPGNHDLSNAVQDEHWRRRFGRRYYHFVYRDVLFLALNADDPPNAGGGLSDVQIAFARKVLEEKRGADWSILVLHRPLWDQSNLASNGWLEIESALKGRRYTVFAGHEHSYRKFVRNGMNHYQLATTGGASALRGPRHGEFDHIAWVTMEKTGPTVANILLDGVLGDDGKP